MVQTSTYAARQWSSAFALIAGAGFIICFFWGSLLADPALKDLHMALLKMSFPGFTGLTIGSFLNGFIQSIIWGLIIGWALASSLNRFAR